MSHLKIAFIVEQFPTLSETFTLNQITGLIDLGHDVDINAANYSDGETSEVHQDVLAYQTAGTHLLCAKNNAPSDMASHKRSAPSSYVILQGSRIK